MMFKKHSNLNMYSCLRKDLFLESDFQNNCVPFSKIQK